MRRISLVESSTMAMRRPARFYWYRRFWSVVTKTSNSISAARSKSPFFMPVHPGAKRS